MNRMGNVTDGTAAGPEISTVRAPKIERQTQARDTIAEAFSEHIDALETKAALLASKAEPILEHVENGVGAAKERAAEEVEPATNAIGKAWRGSVAQRLPPLLKTVLAHNENAGLPQDVTADRAVPTRRKANILENDPTASVRIDRISPSLDDSSVEAADSKSATERPPNSNELQRTLTAAGFATGVTRTATHSVFDRVTTLRQPQFTTNTALQQSTAVEVSIRPTASADAKLASNAAGKQTFDRLITVVRQETHSPPPVHLSPAAQVANALIAEVQASESLRQSRSAAELVPTSSTTGGVVRVLQIRLEPAELGAVSIRLKLEAHALELRIDADQPSTADLIRRDQSALTRLLQSAGYDVEALTVYVTEPDRSATSGGQLPQQGSQGTAHQTTSNMSSGGGQPEERFGEHQSPIRQDGAGDSGTADTSKGRPNAGAPDRSGIYL